MRRTKGRKGMRFCGLFFKFVTNVSAPFSLSLSLSTFITNAFYHHLNIGSRYIYDLYYEKEAISKQLYDWLLKNNYADANLIAKWKKQGYEKVSLSSYSPPFPRSAPRHRSTFLQTDKTAPSAKDFISFFPALLPALHPDQGNQLQRNVYLPRAQGTAQGRPNGSMRKLRMSRMFKLGLAGSPHGVLKTRER
jgi:bud site selection protein 31